MYIHTLSTILRWFNPINSTRHSCRLSYSLSGPLQCGDTQDRVFGFGRAEQTVKVPRIETPRNPGDKSVSPRHTLIMRNAYSSLEHGEHVIYFNLNKAQIIYKHLIPKQ